MISSMQEADLPMQQPVLYQSELPAAGQTFDDFVSALSPAGRVTIVCDGDVDGLGAGVVLWYFLTRRGFDANEITVVQPGKGENAFTPTTRGYVARSHPRALFVLDLGVSDRQIIHSIPTLFIDHHKPSGFP